MGWQLPVGIITTGVILFIIVAKLRLAERALKIKPKMEMGIEIPCIAFMAGLLLGLIL